MCDVKAVSSANSIFLMRKVRTLVFAFRGARLNSFPSLLVCGWTPSSEWRNAKFRIKEKEMPNKVGARTQPCFTPLRILKGSDDGLS